MDKSNRLPLVLGELKVPAHELDSDEWLAVITRALLLCSQHVKFLPGFQPLDLISYELPHSRTKDFRIMFGNSPTNLAAHPRCIRLTKAKGERGKGGVEDIVLLTQKGELLHLQRVYVWEGPHDTGVFSEQLWKLEYLALPDLREFLSPEMGVAILTGLIAAADQGYENRLKHAESIREVRDNLTSIKNIITC